MVESLENQVRKLRDLKNELKYYIQVTTLPETSKKRINELINKIYGSIDNLIIDRAR